MPFYPPETLEPKCPAAPPQGAVVLGSVVTESEQPESEQPLGMPPERSRPQQVRDMLERLRERSQGNRWSQEFLGPTGSSELFHFVLSTGTSGAYSFSEMFRQAFRDQMMADAWLTGQFGDRSAGEDEREKAYRQIGWWKGPQPPRELRRERQSFWAAAGEGGVRWLIKRLRQEHNIEVLHGAASLLASLGPVIVPPILDELAGPHVGDNGLALLGALEKLPRDVGQAHETRLVDALQSYLGHPSLELREAAAGATAILPAERAIRMLQDALRLETNPVVRETLEDAIADRQEEQD